MYLRERRLAAGRSHGNIVLVAGEAGVGKSRLLSEFASALNSSRWNVLKAQCMEFGVRPYGPIVDTLSALGVSTPRFDEARSKLDQFEIIVSALRSRASRSSVMLIVEDIHWADSATIEALLHIANYVSGLRLFVLCTYRSEEIKPDHPLFAIVGKLAQMPSVSTLNVAPLEEPERDCFIKETLGGIVLPYQTRAEIARLSDGNPFFMEELSRNAVEHPADPGAAAAHLPLSVQAAVEQRLRNFGTAEQTVLRSAAVIGRRFDVTLLAKTLGCTLDDLWPALRKGRDLQVLVETADGTLYFRHALTREAIYATFLGKEVRERHRAIAQILEDEDAAVRDVELLAYHWAAAGDKQRAARYGELAGDAAAKLFAHSDAIRAYEEALISAEDTADRVRLYQKIGDHHAALGEFAAAEIAHDNAAEYYRELGDVDQEALYRVRVSLDRYTLDKPDPAVDLVAMLRRLSGSEWLAASRLHLGIAWIEATFNNPTAALSHLELVDERAIAEASDVALRFYNIRAWVQMLIGDLEAFARDHAQWVNAAERSGQSTAVAAAWYNGSACFAMFGQHERAATALEAAMQIARRERNRNQEASTQSIRALNAIMRGDLADARAALQGLEGLVVDNAVTRAHAIGAATLAGTHLGDQSLIDRWYDADKPLSSLLVAECAAGCAEVLVRRRRLPEAQAILRQGIGEGERQRGKLLLLLGIARYGTDDDRLRARDVLARSADAPSEVPEIYALALFDAICAQRAGDGETCSQQAHVAAEGFKRLRFPLLHASALEIAGDVTGARDIYVACGAVADARRCSTHGRESASAVPNGESLSEREHEVATLIARGYSNLQIGRELHISPKTVEKYVTSAFRKLGVSSRAELAAHLVRSQHA
ncbi:MAG: AAA family ATPase [Candidatus Eremiobacteraeota bacterium]|nr:AAA family ATPase [Candidatus Eremiobacteraeota bacterium]